MEIAMIDSELARERYGEWITREVFLERALAEPDIIARSIRLFAASAAQMDSGSARVVLMRNLLENSRFRNAIRNDPILWDKFGAVFEPARVISGVAFDQQSYLDAVHLAERGFYSQLAGRDQVEYELRPLSYLAERVTGVGIVRDGVVIGMDSDWRRNIPYATDEKLWDLLNELRVWLELSKDELNNLYEQLRSAAPIERTRILDRCSKLGHLYLASMHSQLEKRLYAEELVPIQQAMLARYAGFDEMGGGDIDSATEVLLSRCNPYEVFERLAGLPVRIGDAVINACIAEAGSTEGFVRMLLHAPYTPLTRMHVLRVVSERLTGAMRRRYMRLLVRAAIGDLLSNRTAFHIDWIRWISDELLRAAESGTWPEEQRLIVAWIYGGQVARVLALNGFDIEAAVDVRRTLDCHDDLFYGPPAGLISALNPNNISAERLFLTGLNDALPVGLEKPLRIELRDALRLPIESVPWQIGLYTPAVDGRSWFSFASVDALRSLLGADFAEETAQSFSSELLENAFAGLCDDLSGLPIANAASLFGGTAAALIHARRALAAGSTFEDLAATMPYAWQLRVMTIARICAVSGTDEDLADLQKYFANIVAMVSKDDERVLQHALTLLRIAGLIARTKESVSERFSSFSSSLLLLAEASSKFSRLTGLLGRRLLSRLPASLLDEKLSRVVLLSRFRTS